MLIKTDLNKITADDFVVLANLQQVGAFKKTWRGQKGVSRLPKIMAWQQYLCHLWEQNKDSEQRLISAIESGFLLADIIEKSGQKPDETLIDEVLRNYNYCADYLIDFKILPSASFKGWIQDYQHLKAEHNLVDINDIGDVENPQKIYIYGFKTLTPRQNLLFTKTGFEVLSPKLSTIENQQRIFATKQDEILSAARWASSILSKNKDQQIAIIVPNLVELRHQFKMIFDAEFADILAETGQKSYNISLGLPLTEYPLIQHLLMILKLSQQIKQDQIDSKIFNKIITSPYILGATHEKSARSLLINQILLLKKTDFKLAEIKDKTTCPQLFSIIFELKKAKTKPINSTDGWQQNFNKTLQLWGFANDRTLSNSEYQLLNKYQTSSLGMNKLATFIDDMDAKTALQILKTYLSQVIFQAQNAKSSIQILGVLEAESLHFDKAWVTGMSDDFLPRPLQLPAFIPFDIAAKHQILHSSYELLIEDAKLTFADLQNLASEVIFSYAAFDSEVKKHPSALLKWESEVEKIEHQSTKIEMQFLADDNAPNLIKTEVSGGVSILKNQMECAFKGFANRLNINEPEPPHLGFSRVEQGNITHKVLEEIYSEINNKAAILALNKDDLTTIIISKITKQLAKYPKSGFLKIEQKRQFDLIYRFIDTEKQRDDFKIESVEKTIKVNVSGLKFNTRLDRIDEIDGQQIIFDYKTGDREKSLNNLCGNIIKEPQLPIYAISNPVDGVAFIQLQANKISIKGITKNPDLLPKSGRNNCEKWTDQVKIWQQKLNQASTNFQQGKSQVLPTPDACTHCNHEAICRVE